MINDDRYPHKCPECDAPAWRGGKNNVECTNTKCLHLDPKLRAMLRPIAVKAAEVLNRATQAEPDPDASGHDWGFQRLDRAEAEVLVGWPTGILSSFAEIHLAAIAGKNRDRISFADSYRQVCRSLRDELAKFDSGRAKVIARRVTWALNHGEHMIELTQCGCDPDQPHVPTCTRLPHFPGSSPTPTVPVPSALTLLKRWAGEREHHHGVQVYLRGVPADVNPKNGRTGPQLVIASSKYRALRATAKELMKEVSGLRSLVMSHITDDLNNKLLDVVRRAEEVIG